MIINSCGNGCFKVQTSGLNLMIEPFEGEFSARFKPDILLSRHPNSHPPSSGSIPNSHIINGPGEYEIKGIEIKGLPQGSYLVKAEDLKLGFLVHQPAEKNNSTEELEGIDILFTPVTDETEKVIKDLEPKIVIPSTEDASKLAKVFNQKLETQEKFVIKKKDLPATGPQIIVLQD